MKILTFSVFLSIFVSCGINRNFKTVKYPTNNLGKELTMRIPKGYAFIHVGWESTNDGYKYGDSSLVYVSDEKIGGGNHKNIEESEFKNKFFIAVIDQD